MSFGEYFQNVVVVLSNLGWNEHANALLYTNGAPRLLNLICRGFFSGIPVQRTAIAVDKALNDPFVDPVLVKNGAKLSNVFGNCEFFDKCPECGNGDVFPSSECSRCRKEVAESELPF